MEESRVHQFFTECRHGVPQVAPIYTDEKSGGSVEKDGGGDENGKDERNDDGC